MMKKRGSKSTAHALVLFRAVESGSKDAVKKALNHCSVNVEDDEGQTALHVASQDENVEIVKFLLQRKANVNAQDGSGWTPIICAAKACNLKVLAVLLQQRNASVDLLNSDGTSALSYLVRQPFHKVNREMPLYLHVLNEMVERGADVNLVNRVGEAPLHGACGTGNVESIRFLLGAGARVNTTTLKGDTGLHRAVMMGKTNIVQVLLEYGADPLQANHDGITPLAMALESKKSDMIALLTARSEPASSLMMDARFSGFVQHITGKNKLKERFLVLNEMTVTIFPSDSPDAKMCGFFDMKKCQAKAGAEDCEHPHVFQLIQPGRTEVFKVKSQEELDRWLAELRERHLSRRVTPDVISTRDPGEVTTTTDAEARSQLQSYLEIPGNRRCSECGKFRPEYVAPELGVFLCYQCARVISELEIATPKSIHTDQLSSDEVTRIKMSGNVKANQKNEAFVPLSVVRPEPKSEDDIRKAFIKSKYIDKAFTQSVPLTPEESTLKHLLAKRLRFLGSEATRKLTAVMADLCIEPSIDLTESPIFRGIHAQLNASASQAEELPDDTVMRILEQSDASAVGICTQFYAPMVAMTLVTCEALEKHTPPPTHLSRKFLTLFVDRYEHVSQNKMTDEHLNTVLAWWFPQLLELSAIAECTEMMEFPTQHLVLLLKKNTAIALHLLSGEYMAQEASKFSRFETQDTDISKAKHRQAAMKQLKEKSKQHTDQLRKILHNLRKHYNSACEGRVEGQAALFGGGGQRNQIGRTLSNLSASSLGYTTSMWSSPPTSPRHTPDSSLSKLCTAQPNQLTGSLLRLLSDIPDGLCRSVLKLEKTGSTVAPVRDDAASSDMPFGPEGEQVMKHIRMLHDSLRRLRVLYECPRNPDANRLRFNRRQIYVTLATLESVFLQPVPFVAPEMWTSLRDLLEEYLSYMLLCERRQLREELLELQSTILVQLRWTVAKLVELQALEEAHLSF